MARNWSRLARRMRRPFARVHPAPVLVFGNQKSGTSAIAALLAELCELSCTIDVAPLMGARGHDIMAGRKRFAEVVEEYPEFFTRELVKEPMFTFFADQVLARFPASPAVYVARDPRDNLRSLLNSRRLPGDLAELGDEHRRSLGKRVTVDPRVWGGAGENYVGVLAHRWNLATDAWRRHSGRLVLARYEDFLLDKQGFLRELARGLGLTPRRDLGGRVDVDFQPRGDRGARWDTFFGRQNLARIERICAPGMRALGYEPSAHEPGAPPRDAAGLPGDAAENPSLSEDPA